MNMLRAEQGNLTPEHIRNLVDAFYDRIQLHPLLGPIFNAIVTDWDAHKQRLTSFWCSVALGTRRYRGNPLARHQPLPIDREHFRQWLALWQETTRDVLDADAAEHMRAHAGRIALGMQLGMRLLPRPGKRDALSVSGSFPPINAAPMDPD